jgi:hypothetical protein
MPGRYRKPQAEAGWPHSSVSYLRSLPADSRTGASAGASKATAERKQVVQKNEGNIVKFWSAALAAALHDADVIQVLLRSGVEGVSSTPTQFAAFLHDQRDRWKKVVDETGIRIK